MSEAITGAEAMKRAAALRALALVDSGMLLGLGTGSTARWLVEELGRALARGELTDVRGVATSRQTETQAAGLGIPLVDLPPEGVDLAIDGMDELTVGLDAVKGLGGALTREKIVATAAKRFVLIGDATKLVAHLGEKAPLPVEVVRFGRLRTERLLTEFGGEVRQRLAGTEPFVTDNGNLVYDIHFQAPFDARSLAARLADTPGVVEHGLFLGMAERAFVATATGVDEVAG
ncbi:MAG: ribose-5-phosphate isomerase RpiA [Trueperaceae bacterium]|nr:ribose-5-phosphate isomerase RpiA [Trueperaceae bacterium]MCW5819293.1 ribose-5-phosphate isomerase RpiA [Trueperaceae bacterium]